MKTQTFNIQRFDADEGKVFDWKTPRFHEEKTEDGEIIKVQEHLYSLTLFLGANDSIDNYIEVNRTVNGVDVLTVE